MENFTLVGNAPHWRRLNAWARLFGLMALLATFGFSATAFNYWQHPEQASVVSSASGSALADSIGVAIFSLVVGVLFLTVEPYRPDLKRSRQAEAADRRPRRSWWTGEPK